MKDIGEIIKQVRKEKHLTQSQLAKIFFVTEKTISNYENGVRTPDIEFISKFCKEFNLSLDDFVTEKKRLASDGELTSIYENNLKGAQINGNFVYKEGKNYYFLDEFCHSLFREATSTDVLARKNFMSFEKYVEDFCCLCSKIVNSPNIIFYDYFNKNLVNKLNENGRKYKIVDNDELKDKSYDEMVKFFDDETFITNINRLDIFLRYFIEKRQKTSKNLIIFVYQPERTKAFEKVDFSVLLPQCKDKNVFFIFNILNKDKFIENYGEENFNAVSQNCKLQYACGNNDVINIESENHSTIFDNFANYTKKTLKNDEKSIKKPDFIEKSSFKQYLFEKNRNNENYGFDLLLSGFFTLRRAKKVIKDMPDQLKEWYSTYDGGTINNVEMFGTKSQEGTLTLKEANSEKFIKENGLSDAYYYIGRLAGEYYIALKKNWHLLKDYSQNRDFCIIDIPYDEKQECVPLDLYEILDYIRQDID